MVRYAVTPLLADYIAREPTAQTSGRLVAEPVLGPYTGIEHADVEAIAGEVYRHPVGFMHRPNAN